MDLNSNESRRHAAECLYKKFEQIPEEGWCTDRLFDEDGRRCAIGWTLLDRTGKENQLICSLQTGRDWIPAINNGLDPRYPQPTPKGRVLAWLHDLIKL